MTTFDFSKMTTDDLLDIIPPTETSQWEYKAADIFEKANFGEFKSQKLGKIVSAFANSGGGYLLLGKRDGQATFEDVPKAQGRNAMEDHLSLVISQSVIPHYRDFAIHRVPIAGKAGESVLVVEFRDSLAAPHQSVSDVNYFYRLPGHSMPAPHFHLDLLRNRLTRCVLKIQEIGHLLDSATRLSSTGPLYTSMRIVVRVENTSSQCATNWGVHLKHADELRGWTISRSINDLSRGFCALGQPTALLPRQVGEVEFQVEGTLRHIHDWETFGVTAYPVSHNHTGEERFYGWRTQSELASARLRLESDLHLRGISLMM